MRAAGVPFEIIPGVTAATAAAALAGISLTERGAASMVVLATGTDHSGQLPATLAEYQYEHDLSHAAGTYPGPGWMLYRARTGLADWTTDREEGKRAFRGCLLGNLKTLFSMKPP